jgi:acyl-CoA synthetase (AMP-forming)/AMP-acid ligase II
LNPAYSLPEFRFYLEDLQASAVITIPGFCPNVEAAAHSLGLPLVSLTFDNADPTGVFRLGAEKVRGPITGPEDNSDFALLLHSSGTTARPKLVGLTHANLNASARAIAKTLRLTPNDRGLNIMPLFHIHGLVGSLLSSLSAGSSVYCTPGFDALRFARWMAESEATWYTAVPTMHQALLGRSDEIRKVKSRDLRFIRSSSAHLHNRIWRDMEAQFSCPVLNAYGMTEAAHQITSNPLPPLERRYGSVGMEAGPEIAILDPSGKPQAAGYKGEVGIRGKNVTPGYLVPTEANLTAFDNGWFRTGDEGVLDADGYLSLTGRLKELINCAGEKISPAEVDAVLMQHPAVVQAVTFAIRSESRGERVCAAVVLDGDATEIDLKRFARERLAAFKAPARVLIVSEIPKGPTGKMQRAGMATRLGLE